jgi:hypothetical protein
MKRTRAWVFGSLCFGVFIAVGCSSNAGSVGDGGSGDGAGDGKGGGGTGGSGTAGTSGQDASGGASGAGADGGTGPAAALGCAVATAQCSNGIDDDKDGKIDGLDEACVGPCDNDESSFATGISGDNIDACKQDCFFDGNSGMGDDGCEWNLKCDPKNPGQHAAKPCPYDSSYKNCPAKQSARCISNCRKLTPNGCDCFGCCAVTVGNMTDTVLLVNSCTEAVFGDKTKCPRCTQTSTCVNTCEKCEVCVGKPAPDPSCAPVTPLGDGGAAPANDAGVPAADAPPGITCDPGIISCGPGGQVAGDQCGAGKYCITGCCIKPAE